MICHDLPQCSETARYDNFASPIYGANGQMGSEYISRANGVQMGSEYVSRIEFL